MRPRSKYSTRSHPTSVHRRPDSTSLAENARVVLASSIRIRTDIRQQGLLLAQRQRVRCLCKTVDRKQAPSEWSDSFTGPICQVVMGSHSFHSSCCPTGRPLSDCRLIHRDHGIEYLPRMILDLCVFTPSQACFPFYSIGCA